MNVDHNHQKKIAVINDMTGFGRCSIASELPIISALKVQCCPLPTSVFSNHTGFPSFYYRDFTEHMTSYMEEWKKLDLRFKGICTGFLGSKEQIQIVINFLEYFKREDTIIVIDPVMGDYGKPYPTYTMEMCLEMKKMTRYADIMTPNLTEACILTDHEYHDGRWPLKEVRALAEKLCEMGPNKIVITGIPQGEFIANYCYEKGVEPKIIRTHKIGQSRSGTGDVFCAIIAADAVNGVDFQTSVRKASRFIKKCILKAIEMDLPLTDGVPFEELLSTLK